MDEPLHCYEREVFGHPCEALAQAKHEAAMEIAAWLQHVDRLSEVPGARSAMPTHNPLWDAAEMIRERFARVEVT